MWEKSFMLSIIIHYKKKNYIFAIFTFLLDKNYALKKGLVGGICIQFFLLIYLLRHKYLQHSSWLHSTLLDAHLYMRTDATAYNRFCRKTLSEIGIWHSKPLIVPSKGCVKGSFFLFFQHTIEARKRKANPLKYIVLIRDLKI